MMDSAADRFGFIAVYPNDTSRVRDHYIWNAGSSSTVSAEERPAGRPPQRASMKSAPRSPARTPTWRVRGADRGHRGQPRRDAAVRRDGRRGPGPPAQAQGNRPLWFPWYATGSRRRKPHWRSGAESLTTRAITSTAADCPNPPPPGCRKDRPGTVRTPNAGRPSCSRRTAAS
jgi:hypothetical protein